MSLFTPHDAVYYPRMWGTSSFFPTVPHYPAVIPTTSSVVPVMPVSAIGARVFVQPPYYNLPASLDLDQDKRVHKQVTKEFRKKALTKWLYNDLSDLLGYFTVDSSGVSFIKSLDDYKPETVEHETESVLDDKVDYIAKYVLTYDTMFRILKKLIKGANLHWYSLPKNDLFVKEFLGKQLKKIFRDTVESLSKLKK